MDEVNKLVNYLRENAMKHSVLLDDIGCVIAFSYYDPILAPIPHEGCAVYTSDVTFGITDPASGINKWSFFSRLTAGTKCLFVCFFLSFYLTFVKVVGRSMELPQEIPNTRCIKIKTRSTARSLSIQAGCILHYFFVEHLRALDLMLL